MRAGAASGESLAAGSRPQPDFVFLHFIRVPFGMTSARLVWHDEAD
jgi:hypothetical protein